jgi:hypothetical protein
MKNSPSTVPGAVREAELPALDQGIKALRAAYAASVADSIMGREDYHA